MRGQGRGGREKKRAELKRGKGNKFDELFVQRGSSCRMRTMSSGARSRRKRPSWSWRACTGSGALASIAASMEGDLLRFPEEARGLDGVSSRLAGRSEGKPPFPELSLPFCPYQDFLLQF